MFFTLGFYRIKITAACGCQINSVNKLQYFTTRLNGPEKKRIHTYIVRN